MSTLWKNDIWQVDSEVNCINCCYYWDHRCHAIGKRFFAGYCECYEKKCVYKIQDPQDVYESYMREWN